MVGEMVGEEKSSTLSVATCLKRTDRSPILIATAYPPEAGEACSPRLLREIISSLFVCSVISCLDSLRNHNRGLNGPSGSGRLDAMKRRDFLKLAGAGCGGLAVLGPAWAGRVPQRKGRLVDPARKLRIACVGCGGRGAMDIEGVSTEEIVALCDVDDVMAVPMEARFPKARRFRDFRKMLLDMDRHIDAVTVSVPDHMHFACALMAMTMGKHVFVQKPLAHTVWEVRELMRVARRHEVVTQMGNQGHALEGIRITREWVASGAIGAVREVHVWTDKLTVGDYRSELRDRPAEEQVVPEGLEWNLWLGTAALRPYHEAYVPRTWRGWLDFGCGALGDIGCHTMDAPVWSLGLGSPTTVEAETTDFNDEVFPEASKVTYRFPSRQGRPPVKMVWYDGGWLPEHPAHLEPGRELSPRGCVIVGQGASIMDQTEKARSPRIIPETSMELVGAPEKRLPRVAQGDHYQEWIRACKGGPTPGSSFDYAGPLSEIVLLGCVAIRARKRIEWDSVNLRCRNLPEAATLIRHPYRVY